MNRNKRIASIYFVVLALVIILGIVVFTVKYVSNKLDEKFNAQIQEVMGNTYQQQAIMDLCEVRGRVNQLKKLHTLSVSENTLMSELKYISSFQDSNNPYLKNFTITITSSDVGEVCEEILSQINAQIDFIKLATEDA